MRFDPFIKVLSTCLDFSSETYNGLDVGQLSQSLLIHRHRKMVIINAYMVIRVRIQTRDKIRTVQPLEEYRTAGLGRE